LVVAVLAGKELMARVMLYAKRYLQELHGMSLTLPTALTTYSFWCMMTVDCVSKWKQTI
jgi:hypothetical protein